MNSFASTSLAGTLARSAPSSALFTRRVIDTTGKPACIPMTAHEIVSMGMVMRGQDFAGDRCRGASLDDLDPQRIRPLPEPLSSRR